MMKHTATNQANGISHDEIALLAYMIWEKEGCLVGRDRDYWMEAEMQLKAARRHAAAAEKPAAVAPSSVNAARKPAKSPASLKKSKSARRQTSLRVRG